MQWQCYQQQVSDFPSSACNPVVTFHIVLCIQSLSFENCKNHLPRLSRRAVLASSLMQCGGGASHAERACLLYVVWTLAIVVSIISEKACRGPTVQTFRAVVANLGYG